MTKQQPQKSDQPVTWHGAEPVDPATLSPAMVAEIARKLREYERRTERAAVLDAKLRALIGHAGADVLGARGLTSEWHEPQLCALENLVDAVELAHAEAKTLAARLKACEGRRV
jgi:hypothetical protein